MSEDDLKALYENYPYPGTGPMPPARELSNLLKLYRLEVPGTYEGLRILDVGVGSGNRLLELVKAFPNNDYTAIDYSEEALREARRKFADEGLTQVSFMQANLEETLSNLDEFDIVFCMGVLHHLKDPQDAMMKISALCGSRSTLFFYVYGELGSHERLRRKRILEILAGDKKGLEWFDWVRRCDFVDLPYGWRDLGDGLPLYLDAYKNPREQLFTCERIFEILKGGTGQLQHFAIYSWIANGSGWLIDADSRKSRLPIKTTLVDGLSSDSELVQRFHALSTVERIMLLEQIYEPEAYTVALWSDDAFSTLPEGSRLSRSSMPLG